LLFASSFFGVTYLYGVANPTLVASAEVPKENFFAKLGDAVVGNANAVTIPNPAGVQNFRDAALADKRREGNEQRFMGDGCRSIFP
jgi:hypothetical protein